MNNNFYSEYNNENDTVNKVNNYNNYNNNNNSNNKNNYNNYNNNNSNNKNIIISIILFILLIGLIVGYFVFSNNNNEDTNQQTNNNQMNSSQEKEEEPKKINIVNLDDKRRPYGIMINNHHAAWPHAGLSKAYLIYEIMVEGGITRMFALFTQDQDVSKLGSVRSARHNYLDYALENDAIFFHFGGSPYAYDDIKSLKINNVDGNTFASSYFYRDYSLNRSLEHTVFTSSTEVLKAIDNYKFRNERDKDFLLNYSTEEVNLNTLDKASVANNISIKYSYYQTSNYTYNSTDKMYYRSMNGVNHTDLVTNEQYKFKNIIIYSIKYNTMSNGKHQDLQNVGSGEGYYITNGYSIPILWEKKTRDSQTIYKYLNGNEIDVNDGNTFIQIYPTTGSLSIS